MSSEEKAILAALGDFEKGMKEGFSRINERIDRIDEKAGNISGDLKKIIELLREQNRKLDEDSR